MRLSTIFHATMPRRKFFVSTNIIGIVVLTCIIIIFLFFIWLKVGVLLSAPDLYILYPEDTIAINTYLIEIKGKTNPGNRVQVNDQEIVVSSDGVFSRVLNLHKGLNILKIIAFTKYNKTSIVERRVLVE